MKETSRMAKILGLIFLGVLAVLVILKEVRQGIYTKTMGINVAIIGDSRVGLLMLRPEEDVVGFVLFPENLMIKIDNSDARYPIASLWDYGVLEKRPYEVIKKSIGLSMGVVIARMIKVEGEASIEKVLSSLHRLGLKTDLSIRDRFQVRQSLAEATVSKKVLEMDIPKKIFDKTVEPDGKELLTFNSVASLWTKNKFVLLSILSEDADLTVNNLSGLSGLGIQVAKQLESTGIRVTEVKTDLNRDVPGRGCLYSVKGKFASTELLLTNQMNCSKVAAMLPEEEGIAVWLKN